MFAAVFAASELEAADKGGELFGKGWLTNSLATAGCEFEAVGFGVCPKAEIKHTNINTQSATKFFINVNEITWF
ncbi:MAG: hypothetical protein M3209_16710 [Acidobacteriota bacterium]|nr:hypothetical protein [Acidobacteriota bacterium]